MIIITTIIPFPTATTNKQKHHFKTVTTYTCPRYIAGVSFDSVGSLWTTLLLRITSTRSCCHGNWKASCVSALQTKNQNVFTHYYCGLPYYCAPLVCVPAVIGLLAVWRHNKPKTNSITNWWTTDCQLWMGVNTSADHHDVILLEECKHHKMSAL